MGGCFYAGDRLTGTETESASSSDTLPPSDQFFRLDFQSHVNPGYRITFPATAATAVTTGVFSGRGSDWDYTHNPDGGWNNRGYARWTWPAESTQVSGGFHASVEAGAPNGVWPERVFIRYRKRYVNHIQNQGFSINNKFFIWHQHEANNGDDRLMIHHTAGSNDRQGIISPAGGATTHVGEHGARNIGPPSSTGQDGAGKALLIATGWHHIQLEFVFGSSPSIKFWSNNNDYDTPDDTSPSFTSAWPLYQEGMIQINLGHFLTNAPGNDHQWDLQDFEAGPTFDATWYPEAPTGLPWVANFETGDLTQFNGGAPAEANLTVSTTSPQEGTYAATAPLVSGSSNADLYAEHYFGDHVSQSAPKMKVEEVYLRFYTKFNAGYTWPATGHKVAILDLTDGLSTTRRYQTYISINSNGTPRVDYSYWGTQDFFGLAQNQNLPAFDMDAHFGSWVKFKLYVRLNTPGDADGIIRLWINDTLKLQETALNLRESTSYGINKVLLSGWATPSSPTSGTQWWDGWVLSQNDPG